MKLLILLLLPLLAGCQKEAIKAPLYCFSYNHKEIQAETCDYVCTSEETVISNKRKEYNCHHWAKVVHNYEECMRFSTGQHEGYCESTYKKTK